MAIQYELPNVLLIDDDPLVLQAIAMLFETIGWNPSKVSQPDQALILLRDQNFQLVIVDLRMPDIDGIELCRRIRGQSKEPAPIIFLLSGYVDSASHARAEMSGVDDILNKPISLSEMKDRLRKFGLPVGTP